MLLLFAGGVVETFHRSYDRSFRTPAAWIGVVVEPGRHDRVHVTIGRTGQPSQRVYGPSVELSWTNIKFDPCSARPRLTRSALLGETGGVLA